MRSHPSSRPQKERGQVGFRFSVLFRSSAFRFRNRGSSEEAEMRSHPSSRPQKERGRVGLRFSALFRLSAFRFRVSSSPIPNHPAFLRGTSSVSISLLRYSGSLSPGGSIATTVLPRQVTSKAKSINDSVMRSRRTG